jgi:hypothetical protein
VYEIVSTDPAIVLNGSKFRKEIIKFGQYRHPNPLFSDDKDFDWTFAQADADEMIANFQAGLVDSVKFIDAHDETNTRLLGTVVQLEKTDSGVTAVIDVEDEQKAVEIRSKMGDGKSLASGISVGLDNAYRVSDATNSKKRAQNVLRHVASVTIPWINGLEDWQEIGADNTKLNFGHENYTGTPLVGKEDKTDMTEEQRKAALKIIIAASNKTEAEVLKLLADAGIDLAGEPVKKDEIDPTVKAVMDAIKGLANADDDDDEEDEDKSKDDKSKNDSDVSAALAALKSEMNNKNAGVAKVLTELTGLLQNANSAVADQQKAMAAREADEAVATLIKAGQILPKQKEHYVALFLSNKSLFETMTADLPKVIDFNDQDDERFQGIDRPWGSKDLSQTEVVSEADRYLKMAQEVAPGGSDKADKVSGINNA